MTWGFIYFLTNPSMPGLVKIGHTTKHPRTRMKELSAATSCPTPFEMLAFFDCALVEQAEREIHADLDEYRVNESREFFSAPLYVLQGVARQWADSIEGVCHLDYLDLLVDEFFRELEAGNRREILTES